MKKPTLKEVVTSHGGWIILKVKQGYKGRVRIDAHTRFHRADMPNFFSEWGTIQYINRVRREEGLNPIKITEY